MYTGSRELITLNPRLSVMTLNTRFSEMKINGYLTIYVEKYFIKALKKKIKIWTKLSNWKKKNDRKWIFFGKKKHKIMRKKCENFMKWGEYEFEVFARFETSTNNFSSIFYQILPKFQNLPILHEYFIA